MQSNFARTAQESSSNYAADSPPGNGRVLSNDKTPLSCCWVLLSSKPFVSDPVRGSETLGVRVPDTFHGDLALSVG